MAVKKLLLVRKGLLLKSHEKNSFFEPVKLCETDLRAAW